MTMTDPGFHLIKKAAAYLSRSDEERIAYIRSPGGLATPEPRRPLVS